MSISYELESIVIKMDQSPKAKEVIRRYDQETRNNKWFKRIFDRLQKLSCCVGGEDEHSQEINFGEGDIMLSEPPYLVGISALLIDYQQQEIESSSCEEKVEQPKFSALSLKDLATAAYCKSVPHRRRHVFFQAAYTGGFQSFVGNQ